MIEDQVLEIATKYLKKIRRGARGEISAICPFHKKEDGTEEKHPSFCMNLSRGIYYCHACHVSGNFVSFLRNVGVPRSTITATYQGLIDALRVLRPTLPYEAELPVLETQEPITEAILGVFDQCPLALVDDNYKLDPDDPIFEEWVLKQNDIGFDNLHGRITFPLRDTYGNLVGISGRSVNGSFPRYKIYDIEYKSFGLPARPPTRKSLILWNAHNVYNRVFFSSSEEKVVVVEGFKSCLWLLQAGVHNCVALMGSHLSDQQRLILERMGACVYLMLDNDNAGRLALTGHIDSLGDKKPGIAEELSKSLDVRVVEYSTRQPTGLSKEQIFEALDRAEEYYLWAAKKRGKRDVVR